VRFLVFFEQVGDLALLVVAGEFVDNRCGRVEVLEFGFYAFFIQRFYFQGFFDAFRIIILSLNNKVVVEAADFIARQLLVFGKERF